LPINCIYLQYNVCSLSNIMKVLVIHTSYKFKGGEDSVVSNEIELLQSIGNEVELLQFSNSQHTLFKVLQLPFNWGSYLKTKKTIAVFKPDIVHIHNIHFAGSPSIIYAIKRSGVPFVITLHNYRLLCPSATLFFKGALFNDAVKKPFSWQAIWKGVYLNSRILTFWVSCSMFLHQLIGTWKLPAKYIALGQYTREIFLNSKLKFIADNVLIKPNFCYRSIEQPPLSEESYYLYLGRLSEEKGIKLLLDAFSKNGLPIKIAGDGVLKKEVKTYSKLCPNINFVGSVEKQETSSLLLNARALIFPSLWYETFGMVIIEAFAAGTPVIASRLGQMRFTITDQHNGLHFDTGSVDDLQAKLILYESLSSARRSVYRQNALNSYFEIYSPEKNASQLMHIYSQAISENILQ
jgi:glycosyltransferase involved in cell wall biosynthesis